MFNWHTIRFVNGHVAHVWPISLTILLKRIVLSALDTRKCPTAKIFPNTSNFSEHCYGICKYKPVSYAQMLILMLLYKHLFTITILHAKQIMWFIDDGRKYYCEHYLCKSVCDLLPRAAFCCKVEKKPLYHEMHEI